MYATTTSVRSTSPKRGRSALGALRTKSFAVAAEGTPAASVVDGMDGPILAVGSIGTPGNARAHPAAQQHGRERRDGGMFKSTIKSGAQVCGLSCVGLGDFVDRRF